MYKIRLVFAKLGTTGVTKVKESYGNQCPRIRLMV
jgi:hypothetical protein